MIALGVSFWRLGAKAVRVVTADAAEDEPTEGVPPGATLYRTDTGEHRSFSGSAWASSGGGEPGTTDHGLLTGLADDDHSQYHTDARGDARYVAKNGAITGATKTKVTYDAKGLVTSGADATYSDVGAAAASHTHAQSDVTNLVSALAGKASTSHTHAQADVTNLVTDLAAKAPASAFVTLTTAYTTPGGTTSLQKLFNAPANGAFTCSANKTYFFECYFGLTAMSASSGTFSFGFGGTATFTRVAYFALANKGAATPVAALLTRGSVATAVALCAANTTTTGQASISGKIVVGNAGTIIPSFATSVAAASVVSNDSYFAIWEAGANTVQSFGAWS